MNVILLSGGSGKRLWPLSNDIRAKQFLKIFKKQDGIYESMIQRMYRGIKAVSPDAKITIATGKSQVSAIQNQIGNANISMEPDRRDTFPAIALACTYLHDILNVNENEAVVVCPVDPYVEDDYFRSLDRLSALAEKGKSNLTLMGIEPTYPSEKYGYIIPEDKGTISRVSMFKEKPDKETAKNYIDQGALWNGGVFAFKLRYLLDKVHELMSFMDYDDLYSRYGTLQKISFDYAVVEKEGQIDVLRFNGLWKDLGTWNTLTEAMSEDKKGQGVLENCSNTHLINELNIPVVCMGMKDAVVAASADGILVSDKEQSSYIKPIVDNLTQQVMYAEKSWGSFHVLDVSEDSMTIKVTLLPGHQMNYHSHEKRDEIWSIVSGRGIAIVDGMEQPVKPGDVVSIAAECRHTLIADTKLEAIEVQVGKEISVHDKKKYELET